MLSEGNSEWKSLAFRVMRPSLACASAPIMTSATGRRVVLPDRLRWTWLFHAANAIDRSFSLTPGGRSIPISKRNSRSRASSPRKAGASSTYATCGARPRSELHFCRDFVVIWQDICRVPGGRPCRVTSGVDFEMMTFSTVLARCGACGGASRRMPIGALMSGFENPPPARTPGRGRATASPVCRGCWTCRATRTRSTSCRGG